MSAFAYFILSRQIIRANKDTGIGQALGSDIKGVVSETLYIIGIAVAFINPLISYGFYALVSIMWFIPDRRLIYTSKQSE
jgi:uncharacterized membrane protein